MQPAKHISSEADQWHVRRPPNMESGELLLQFYGENYRRKPWTTYGRFFTINLVRSSSHQFEFKLEGYAEAQKNGIFKIENVAV